MPLEEPETHIDAIIIEPIEPEEIVDQVAGVDSNGNVLLKRHSHSRYPGKVKVYYECEKNEEDPFEALANFFDDILMMGSGDVLVDETPEEIPIPVEESPYNEEASAEETPIVLSKKHQHGGCHSGLKNIADDWDAGAVCGTLTEEITLTCDENRTGARIFVMAVKPEGNKHKHPTETGADTVIDNSQESVENEPFLSKHQRRPSRKQGKPGKKAKQLGWQLTDVCNAQASEESTPDGQCTVVLNEALGEGAFADNPLVTEESPIHVKFMCSYEHQIN